MSSLNKNFTAFNIAFALLIPALIKAQGLINTSSSYIVANGTVAIVCNNSGFTNNGVFNAGSSTISLTGSSSTANSFIAGSSSTVFNNLMMNKTANGVQLGSNITINGTLDLSNGDSLFLNNYNIDLGTTGSISGETSAKRITGLTGGYIQIENALNVPAAINPGNIGIEITSAANLGSTIIRRGHNQQGGASVYRYFDVIPTNNTGLDASITVHYWDQELGTIPESDLGIFFSDDNSYWSLVGQDALNTINNLVTKTGIGHLSRFTLADIGEPLTVTFLYVKANLNNEQTLLDWAVSSELNNDHFEIERSIDGKHFVKLSTVNSAGNTSVTRYYNYIDALPFAGINYYRIKQVDIDNSFSYSDVVTVENKVNLNGFISCYPNPANSIFNLAFSSGNNTAYKMQLFNANGKLVQSKFINSTKGMNQITWDISSLPKGVYTIQILGSKFKTIQFVKM
jgi:hypothetical protein